MWIYLQYSDLPGWRMLVKMLVHKDSLGIFHPSRIETARLKDGWTGVWLRPWCLVHCIFQYNEHQTNEIFFVNITDSIKICLSWSQHTFLSHNEVGKHKIFSKFSVQNFYLHDVLDCTKCQYLLALCAKFVVCFAKQMNLQEIFSHKCYAPIAVTFLIKIEDEAMDHKIHL